MHFQLFCRIGSCAAALAAVALGCSSTPTGDDGGAGGAGTTGGATGSGGVSGSTAGMSTTGGSPATGGSTGGTPPATGGASAGTSAGVGGASTGGSGGSSTGGQSGSENGGAGAGGISGAGGAVAGMGGRGGRGGAGGKGGGGASGTGGTSGASGTGGSGGGGDATKSTGCGKANPPANGEAMISVNGMSRAYTLKKPDDYDANKPYRLIFAFHWLNGTMQNIANGSGTAKAYYGLWDLAQGSTIFVAPQGINNGWSDSGRSTSMGGNDIKFTQALFTYLEGSLCIDKKRVFAEGFSMGGSMSYAVACALPDIFRAVAAHSGGPMSGCVTHNKPVAYFMTHGINDSVCTYPEFGVPQINDFAKVNGCMTATLPNPSSSAASCIDFQGCMTGYPVRGCTFVGDHTPSPPNTNSTWVPAETWKFISQF
jgi:poly(3-hydroxybutyrate) depolymerase